MSSLGNVDVSWADGELAQAHAKLARGAETGWAHPAAAQKLVPQLHEAVAARLRCQDQDQEVKECAIAAAATLAADLGNLLPRALPALLQVRRPRALPLMQRAGMLGSTAAEGSVLRRRSCRSGCAMRRRGWRA